MTTVQDILQFLSNVAPEYMNEEWDRIGLNCGRMDAPVQKILLALDPFDHVCQEAKDFGAAMQSVFYIAALIAVNLSVMNLLPIPALDGGRVVGLLVTTAVETVTRKKINPKYEGYLHAAGMLLLLALATRFLTKH
mgnify:CR=1 FL=1